jgi:hypothetical protein
MQIIKNLLALGISIGLSDRQTFVKKVSGLIEDYQKNPEKAEEWAQSLAKYLEEVKDDIRMQRNIESASGFTKESIEELTKAVHKLTKELQQKKM